MVALRLPAGTTNYQPRLPFWTVREATAQIARLLDGLPDGAKLGAFLPEITDDGPGRVLRCRAAVAATFVAGLELTRSGGIALDQDASWQSIHVRPAYPASERPLPQTRTLDGTLRSLFERWYPGLANDNGTEAAHADAA